MDPVDIGPRPVRSRCRRCKKPIHVKPNGRPRIYCSDTCRHHVYEVRHRKPKLPVEDAQRALLWQTLCSWGVVSGEMPTMPKDAPP